MTTLGTMITKIEGDLGRTDFSSANGPIQMAIQEAIEFYQPQSFYFNDNDHITFNTVVDQVEYDDDDTATVEWTDWYDLKDIFLEEASGKRHKLVEKAYDEIMLLTDTESSSSRPTSYARYAESLYLYPKPDLATYLIRPSGHYKIAYPASSGEASNPWMTKAWDLILHGAKRRLYIDRLKDVDKAKMQGLMEASALEQLHDQTVKKRRTSRIKSKPF